MKPRGDAPRERIPGPVMPSVAIWLAMLVPPAAALAHVAAGYPIEHTACATQTLVGFHALTVVLLLLTAASGIAARREWVRRGSKTPGDSPPPDGTRRFMALIGMLGAILFAFVILIQWLPVTMLPPCVRT